MSVGAGDWLDIFTKKNILFTILTSCNRQLLLKAIDSKCSDLYLSCKLVQQQECISASWGNFP